jgi:hypothetical protein
MTAEADWGKWLPRDKPDGTTVRVLQLPDECRNGHQLGPKVLHVGWIGCLCTERQNGHHIARCMICQDERLVAACRLEEASA